MEIVYFPAVILINDSVKQVFEFGVAILGPCKQADTRILVFDSWKNAKFEWNIHVAFVVFVLLPDFDGQVARQGWIGIGKEELVEVDEVVVGLELRNVEVFVASLRRPLLVRRREARSHQ